jgi:amyloid beta precursor protein binding protein 1
MDNKSRRYDRQLRLWQSHGQMKLEESCICLLNATPLGTEILKNLVLPGIGSFTIVDGQIADETGNFFMQSGQTDKTKAEVCLPYLLELNEEVKGIAVNADPSHMIRHEIDFFKKYNMVIATSLEEEDLLALAEFCYNREITLVVVKICGFFGYLRVLVPELCGKFIINL